jgi:hypothetical protein
MLRAPAVRSDSVLWTVSVLAFMGFAVSLGRLPIDSGDGPFYASIYTITASFALVTAWTTLVVTIYALSRCVSESWFGLRGDGVSTQATVRS